MRDYRLLRERGYPETATLQIVGNRYDLDRVGRSALYRGVFPREASRRRRRKLVGRPRLRTGKPLLVDGYNVLRTVANYLAGRPLFLASDGLLRDAGEAFAAPGDELVLRAADLVLDHLAALPGAVETRFLLDSPVSRSGELAAGIRTRMAARGLSGDARTVRSPDYELGRAADAVVCTSDSAVIDAVPGRVYDLARAVLRGRFGARFPRVGR